MTIEERNQMVAVGLRRIFFLNQLMQHEVEWIINMLPGTRIDRLLRVVNGNLKNQLSQAKVCLGEGAREYLNEVLQADELVALGNVIDELCKVNILEMEQEVKELVEAKLMLQQADAQIEYPKEW
jgi:hypothetical protein